MFFHQGAVIKAGAGGRESRTSGTKLNTEKRPFHACGNTSTVMMVSDGDICSGAESLPYSYTMIYTTWKKKLNMKINEGLGFWKYKKVMM